MNTFIVEGGGQTTPEPSQDWLKLSSLKDASLLAGGITLVMNGLFRRSPIALVIAGIGALVAARTANDWIKR